ncbi:hypothetical protein [Rhizobium sp. Root483D2]|uniref:hypothetical protein n=1 Tax=Rhizobium sp. Root483D2 TaxID=1736545 RepID=UPI0012E3912D|nr:hypothetical protein [Rhizobium sp. Root483D2]
MSENTSNAPMPPPGIFDHLGKILPGAFGDCAADLGCFGVGLKYSLEIIHL